VKRLRHVATVNPPVAGLGRGDAGREISFIPLEKVWGDSRFDPSQTIEFSGDAQSYNPVAEGDLLVPKVSPTFSHGRVALATGLVNGRALATSEVFVVRASDESDARFLRYRLLAADFRQEGEASWTGVAGLKRISADLIRDVRIDDHAWQARRLVAHFLDHESSRIDELAAELTGLTSLIRNSAGQAVAEVLRGYGIDLPADVGDRSAWGPLPEGWSLVLLGRAMRQLTNGYVGPTRDLLVDDGVPYIQSTHIKGGRIDFERRPFYVPEAWHRAHPRINLGTGDVLIVQTGKLGEVALVPDNFGTASCHALLIARAEPTLTSGAYLAAWFGTSFGRQSLLKMATGALHPHLEAGEIRKLHILIPPGGVQAEFAAAVAAERHRLRAATEEVDAFHDRLLEYRDALITEAVTGQLDTARISGSQMDERLAAVREEQKPEVLA
jgi:type I restriction enzyme S subunit